MAHTPHELSEEFPDKVSLMHDLKQDDARFLRLFEDYHVVNRDVHRAETNVTPMSDLTMIDLRKRRARLKDEIWSYLTD